MGPRFPFSGFARQFRTDVQTLACRRIRGGPSVSDRALALDRLAGSFCLVCLGGFALWLATQTLPASLLRIPLVGESAQAAAPDVQGGQSADAAKSLPLSNADVRALQSRLKMLGFDPGPIDGIAGARTLHALNLYRASMKLERVGYIDRSMVADLAD